MQEILNLVKSLAECPYTIDTVTLPKNGITPENREQVVGNMSMSLVKYEKLIELANKIK